MTTRRTFFVSTLTSASALAAAKSANLESRIGKRDFTGLTREDLPTPCMVLDLDLFEKNLNHLADHCKQTGIQLRGHVKIHKSTHIAKRQAAIGAIGVTTATVAECELMANAGIKGVLLTAQAAGREKIRRVAALAKREPTFMTVVDDPIIADQLGEAAAVEGCKINLLVDCYAGLTRQGCETGAKAHALAQRVASNKNLKLRGLMAYSGGASHTHGFETRKAQSAKDLAGMLETAEMCKKSGLDIAMKSGGSTGTYNIDVGSLTELQAGSYMFMDTAYVKVGGKSDDHIYQDFAPALTVMSTVISRTHPGKATIDAGNKAMLKVTDQVKGRSDVKIENQGAEYGLLLWANGGDYKLGDKVELYPTNLDTSTNVYDRYYIARGENIVDAWPVMGRSGAAQR